MQESCSVHVNDHVHHGSRAILPRYLPLVHYLEHGVQYRTVLLVRIVDLDPLEGYLYPVAETHLLKNPCYLGHGGEVQAQGKSGLFCDVHS